MRLWMNEKARPRSYLLKSRLGLASREPLMGMDEGWMRDGCALPLPGARTKLSSGHRNDG